MIWSFQAHGFTRPEPTLADLNLNFRQRSPLPTGQPLNPLEKRQIANDAQRTCGYHEGNPGMRRFLFYSNFYQKVCIELHSYGNAYDYWIDTC